MSSCTSSVAALSPPPSYNAACALPAVEASGCAEAAAVAPGDADCVLVVQAAAALTAAPYKLACSEQQHCMVLAPDAQPDAPPVAVGGCTTAGCAPAPASSTATWPGRHRQSRTLPGLFTFTPDVQEEEEGGWVGQLRSSDAYEALPTPHLSDGPSSGAAPSSGQHRMSKSWDAAGSGPLPCLSTLESFRGMLRGSGGGASGAGRTASRSSCGDDAASATSVVLHDAVGGEGGMQAVEAVEAGAGGGDTFKLAVASARQARELAPLNDGGDALGPLPPVLLGRGSGSRGSLGRAAAVAAAAAAVLAAEQQEPSLGSPRARLCKGHISSDDPSPDQPLPMELPRELSRSLSSAARRTALAAWGGTSLLPPAPAAAPAVCGVTTAASAASSPTRHCHRPSHSRQLSMDGSALPYTDVQLLAMPPDELMAAMAGLEAGSSSPGASPTAASAAHSLGSAVPAAACAAVPATQPAMGLLGSGAPAEQQQGGVDDENSCASRHTASSVASPGGSRPLSKQPSFMNRCVLYVARGWVGWGVWVWPPLFAW